MPTAGSVLGEPQIKGLHLPKKAEKIEITKYTDDTTATFYYLISPLQIVLAGKRWNV